MTDSPQMTLLNAVHRLAADSKKLEDDLININAQLRVIQEDRPTEQGTKLLAHNFRILKILIAQRNILSLVTESALSSYDRIDEFMKKIDEMHEELSR